MAEPIGDVGEDLDPSVVVTKSARTFNKYALTEIAIVRGCVTVKWLTGDATSYAYNDSFRIENIPAVLDDEGQEIEPAQPLWGQLKAQQAFQDFISLIRGALRQQGKV